MYHRIHIQPVLHLRRHRRHQGSLLPQSHHFLTRAARVRRRTSPRILWSGRRPAGEERWKRMRRLKPFVVRSLVVAVTVGTAALSGIAHQRPPDTFAARSYDGDDDRDRDREQYRDHDDDDRDRDRDREEEHEHHKGSATHASPIVTNQSSNTVSVIDTDSDEVVETIRKVGQKPHGIAITGDGRKVLVSQFLALKPANDPRPLTQSEGADDGREG